MVLKKDKQKVLGETFDDERIKTFLDVETAGNVNVDYHILEKAYRGMHHENFKTFIGFFVDAGRDLNAKNLEGKTLLQIIDTHRHGEDYAQCLRTAGASF